MQLRSSKASSARQKPLLRQPLVQLLVAALGAAMVLLYILVGPTRHDPLWWRHAGIQKELALLGVGAEQTRYDGRSNARRMEDRHGNANAIALPPKPPLNPKNGTEYFADYDVSSLSFDPDPPLTQEHPKYLFHYVDPKTSKYPMMYLSNHPRVGWVPNFLSDAECDAIIAEASKTMHRSEVVPFKDSTDKGTVSDVRTSSQTWLSTDSPAAAAVVRRILEFTGFPEGSSEMLQVLRYEVGQKYDAHLDYFDPRSYGPQTSNRALTVYLYLSTVEEGGYTQFPRADSKPETWDFKSCIAGLKVKPVKGTIAFFYDMTPRGEYDPHSLHGACKPVKGTKWGGTLWLRVPV